MTNLAPTISSPPAAVEAAPKPQVQPPRLPARLSQDAIFERLQLAPPAMVKEISDMVVRQMAFETARQQRLDSKATSLLGAVGLTLTVVSTFGVQLLTTLAPAAEKHPKTAAALGVVAFLATLLGLGAALCAIWTLGVRSFAGVNEEAIFSVEAIQAAKAQGEGKDEQEVGVAVYRRMMVEHLWPTVQRQEQHNATKARRVALGQVLFLVFLAFIPVMGLLTFKLH